MQYLLKAEWYRHSDLGPKASLCVATSHKPSEIILPMRQDLGDYVLRMAEVLDELESAEDRLKADILHDLQSPSIEGGQYPVQPVPRRN